MAIRVNGVPSTKMMRPTCKKTDFSILMPFRVPNQSRPLDALRGDRRRYFVQSRKLFIGDEKSNAKDEVCGCSDSGWVTVAAISNRFYCREGKVLGAEDI